MAAVVFRHFQLLRDGQTLCDVCCARLRYHDARDVILLCNEHFDACTTGKLTLTSHGARYHLDAQTSQGAPVQEPQHIDAILTSLCALARVTEAEPVEVEVVFSTLDGARARLIGRESSRIVHEATANTAHAAVLALGRAALARSADIEPLLTALREVCEGGG